MIRINPPIPLSTPKGDAYAHFLIDYGMEEDLLWGRRSFMGMLYK